MAYAKLNGKYIKRNNKPIKVDASIDSNIKPENIKKDVEILGVTGTLESGGGESGAIETDTGTIVVSDLQYITISGLKARPRAVTLVMAENAVSSNSKIDAITYVRGIYNYILTCRRNSSIQYSVMSTSNFYTSYDSMDSASFMNSYSVKIAYENGNLYIKRNNDTYSTFGYSSEYDYVIMY